MKEYIISDTTNNKRGIEKNTLPFHFFLDIMFDRWNTIKSYSCKTKFNTIVIINNDNNNNVQILKCKFDPMK